MLKLAQHALYFHLTQKGEEYLKATGRGDIASLARENMHLLTPDDDVVANPENYFDQVIEIDLDSLEPHVVGPHTPDLARPVSELKDDAVENNYPLEIFKRSYRFMH